MSPPASGVQLGHEVLDRGCRDVEVDRFELLEVGENVGAEILRTRPEGGIQRIAQGSEPRAKRLDQAAATSRDRVVTALTDRAEPESSLG